MPVNQIDKLPVAQRRWTMDVQTALGLKSMLGQNQIVASSIATATRIAETRPNAAGLQARHPNVASSDAFAGVVDHLGKYDQAQRPGHIERSILRSASEIARDADMPAEQDKDCAELLNWLRAEGLREEITAKRAADGSLAGRGVRRP